MNVTPLKQNALLELVLLCETPEYRLVLVPDVDGQDDEALVLVGFR